MKTPKPGTFHWTIHDTRIDLQNVPLYTVYEHILQNSEYTCLENSQTVNLPAMYTQ